MHSFLLSLTALLFFTPNSSSSSSDDRPVDLRPCACRIIVAVPSLPPQGMDRKLRRQSPPKSAMMDRDWTNLPEDIIIIIGQKASTTNVQYVHLRAICKAWRSALVPDPGHLPRQAPWLFIRPVGSNRSQLSFYDLSQSRVHQFESPDVIGKEMLGNYYGWIVLVQEEKVSLYNPVNRGSMELPSLDAPPSVVGVIKPKTECNGRFISRRYVQKVVLSCNPSEEGCIVVAWLITTSSWELAICRIGDTHWTGLKMGEKGPMLLDITCGNNSVYVVTGRKEVLAYDLASLAMRKFPSKINYNAVHDHLNLVEGDAKSDGPLIVISTEYLGKLKRIYVYEWVNNLQRWRRTKNIEKSVLFLSRYNCFQLKLKELCGNEIYYEGLRALPLALPSMDVYYHVGINRMNVRTGGTVPHSPNPSEVCPTVTGSVFWLTPSPR